MPIEKYLYEPYELEAAGGGRPEDFKKSRQRVVQRLNALLRNLHRLEKARKFLEETCKKNPDGLPF